jgi:hypothetical protein
MRRVKSFIMFDFPVQIEFISGQFANTHNNFQRQFPYWSLAATRKKVIADFWFRQVLFHYCFIITTGTLVALLLGNSWHTILLPLLACATITFIVTTAFNYWPVYYADFLPKLDTIIARYEKEMEVAGEIKKCKRTQYSIPTLTIIFHVFSKSLDVPSLACNDRSAELLNNLYGADKDKLKQNLSRLYKLSGLSIREKAEMEKGIASASAFFEELGYSPAQQILEQLELKLQRG